MGGCAGLERPAAEKAGPPLVRLAPSDHPLFADDMGYDGLAAAIGQSLAYVSKVPDTRLFTFGKDRYTAAHMRRSLTRFEQLIAQKPSPAELEKTIAAEYHVYRSTGKKGEGSVLFTGYYEPALKGSLTQSDEFPYPVYTRPDDLAVIDLARFGKRFKGERKLIGRVKADKSIVPYHSRREIAAGAPLAGKASPLAWVGDAVDLFFLEIQGSGRIFLTNGDVINVHYHTSNGRPYRSIGTLLIRENKIPRAEVSMQSIKAWLKANPEEVRRILDYNDSYVFFKLEEGGPYGCLGVALTAGRSLATDRRIFPDAAIAFATTQKPLVNGQGEIESWTNLSRFFMNQDTGGAIRGPSRADIFWGNGDYATIAAGHMKQEGSLYFLVLKPEAESTKSL